jgi:hypothetical protein
MSQKRVANTTEIQMPKRTIKNIDRAFSIETDIVKLDEVADRVLIEGYLGELEKAGFVEDGMLEIKGFEGTLRVKLEKEELRRLLRK